MSTTDTKVSAMLPTIESEQLTRLAERNERSIAAEIRIAIRNHLANNSGPATPTPAKVKA